MDCRVKPGNDAGGCGEFEFRRTRSRDSIACLFAAIQRRSELPCNIASRSTSWRPSPPSRRRQRPARAQDFYRGKTVTLFAGQPPGGGIDSEMRLVARYFGKFIPGEPGFLPMNMQGAGGIILGNHLYSVAKPDGLTLGMPGRSGFALAPIISAADTRYDLRKFTWIGSSASSNFVLWMRRQADIRSFDDLRNAKRPIIIASSGSTTANSIMPEVLARYEKLPLKVVRGYPGINDAVLAVERGEADGVLCQKASMRSDLLASGAVLPVFQVMPIEPGLALLDDLITDPKEKALLELLSAPQRLGLPVIGPPGLSSDRHRDAAAGLPEDGRQQGLPGRGDQARPRYRAAEYRRGAGPLRGDRAHRVSARHDRGISPLRGASIIRSPTGPIRKYRHAGIVSRRTVAGVRQGANDLAGEGARLQKPLPALAGGRAPDGRSSSRSIRTARFRRWFTTARSSPRHR